jgi:hypothetical protein
MEQDQAKPHHPSKRNVESVNDELGTLLGVNLENWTRAWLDVLSFWETVHLLAFPTSTIVTLGM